MRRYAILIVSACMLMVACSKRPGNVLSTKEMAEVLADMHVAEAVVELNPSRFSTDSMKMLLKQSVYAAHGITDEQFDTSLVWYGHNMDKYIEVLDAEIALLEKRDRAAGSMAASMSVAGDSVDLWPGSRYLVLSDRYPTMAVPFKITIDDNCEPGDQYTWRVKVIDNERSTINWTIAASYADSTMEILSMNTAQSGWNEATFLTDSTRILTSLRGQFVPTLQEGSKVVCVDSIQLVRKRVDATKYPQRYRQRSYKDLR